MSGYYPLKYTDQDDRIGLRRSKVSHGWDVQDRIERHLQYSHYSNQQTDECYSELESSKKYQTSERLHTYEPSPDDDIGNYESSYDSDTSQESEIEYLEMLVRNQDTDLKRKDVELKSYENQLQRLSAELQRKTKCLEARTDTVTSLKAETEYLKTKVMTQKDELFFLHLKNNSETDRRDLRHNLRDKEYQLRSKEQLQKKSAEFKRASDCLDEMVDVLERILNKSTTHYPRRLYKLLRRDDCLCDSMRQLQQKVRDVNERMIDMARTFDEQKKTILGLQKNDKTCLEKEEVTLFEERLYCKENEKLFKMTSYKQNDRFKQPQREVEFKRARAGPSESLLQVEKELMMKEVKEIEEKYRNIKTELNSKTLFLERQASVKDAQLSELRYQLKQTLQKSLHGKDKEESYASLKKKSDDLKDEVERCKVKIKELGVTLDHTSYELKDNKEQLRKMKKEKDELLSKQRDQKLQALKQVLKTNKVDSKETYEARRKEIQSTDQEMKTKDSKDKNLENIFDSRAVSLGVLGNELQEQNNLLLEQSVKHRHAMESLKGKNSETERQNETLKKTIQHLEAEVERCIRKNGGLEETPDRKRKEISETNERYVNAVKEKDAISSKFSDLRQRTYKTYDSEAQVNKTVTALKVADQSLEKEINLRDAKLQYLEKQLESKNMNVGERISQLENKVQDKDDQLTAQKYQHQQVVTRLHEKESELEETIISLKKKIQNLEAEVEQSNQEKRVLEETLDRKNKEISDADERYVKAVKEKDSISLQVSDMKKQTFKTYNSEAESNRTISALKVENKNLDKDIKLRDAKVKDLEKQLQSKNRNLEENISQLQNKIQAKDDQLSSQSYQHQQVVRRLREEESKLEATTASLNKKINDLEADAQRLVSKINDLEGQLEKTKTFGKRGLGEDVPGPNGDVPAMENMIADLKQELKQTRTKLRDTEAELNETKTRLSKAMGERLTDNNPNITDLGDKNRPTKLAERFAELYDNQWTDAFDILEKKFDTEEGAIEALLHILQNAMSFCKTKEREQMEELRRVLVFADGPVRGAEAVDMQKLFKDNRKAMAPSAVENLFQVYVEHIRRSTDVRLRMAMEVKSYAKECLEICWLMTVQDPPVVFAPLLRRGAPFNNELFRPYTKSGSNVAFVVWPTLLLHDHGPVLAKGVAQGAGTP